MPQPRARLSHSVHYPGPIFVCCPFLLPLQDKSRNHEERRIAVCLVDDLIENSPAGMAKHFANVSG